MFNQYQVFTRPTDNLLSWTLFKARKAKISNKLLNPTSLHLSFNNKYVNFNKQEQLKSKIIKTILINNKTLYQQIKCRKSHLSTSTKKQALRQNNKLRINLNGRIKKRLTQISKQFEIKDDSFNRTTYCSHDDRYMLKYYQNKNRCQSERSWISTETKKQSYTGIINRIKNEKKSSWSHNKDYHEIKPWIIQSRFQSEFQYC